MNLRTVFIAAPLLMFAYGVIRLLDGLDGVHGPGPAWTTGHLAFLLALIMFEFVFLHLWRLAGRGTLATATLVAATIGAVALVTQFTVDIVVGFMADNHDEMSELFSELQSNTLVSLFVYEVGPYLFYVGQLALVSQLAVQRKVHAWVPALVLVGLVMPAVDKDLIPVAAIIWLVAFVAGIPTRTPARV
jgi:hypothetical protein